MSVARSVPGFISVPVPVPCSSSQASEQGRVAASICDVPRHSKNGQQKSSPSVSDCLWTSQASQFSSSQSTFLRANLTQEKRLSLPFKVSPDFGCSRGQDSRLRMKLASWGYTGPAFIGILRLASAFRNVFGVAATDSDLETLPETIRSLAGGGARAVVITPVLPSMNLEPVRACAQAVKEETGVDVLVLAPEKEKNDLQASDFALDSIVRFYLERAKADGSLDLEKTKKPSANIIGISPSGFHNIGDSVEIRRMLQGLDIDVNVVLAEDTPLEDIAKLPKAWFNLAPYREIGLRTARYLSQEHSMPSVDITPMGILETRRCLLAIQDILNAQGASVDFNAHIKQQSIYGSDAAWFAQSIDCQNLMTKKGCVFGDATHAAALVKILHREMDISIPLAGTYCTEDAEWFRQEVADCVQEIIITDDPAEVEAKLNDILPDAILGTQMERFVGKKLNIPTGVISSPTHVRNNRSSLRPMCGYEGTNTFSDLIYNSFTLGMEDHLIEMFGGHDTKEVITKQVSNNEELEWATSGLAELKKIPGFVRDKVKRNTEKYARAQGISEITVEVLYAAKEAVSA